MTELSYQHKQTLGETRHVVDENTFFDDIVPAEVTDVIRAFAAEFSPLPPLHVPLRKDAQAIYGWPADGVGEKIRTHGGSIRFGWRMREWPRVLLTAEAHAVWVDPDGALIDITPDVADGDISLFVPTSEPFGFGKRPPTRYHVLYSAPDQSQAIAERIARMTSGQRAYEDRRAQKAGQTLDAWIRDKYYHDPLPGLIAAFIAACDAFDAGLPTLPSLIQAVTNAAEEQPPQTLPSAQGRTDDAVPAPVGAMAEDDASAARAENPPVQATRPPTTKRNPWTMRRTTISFGSRTTKRTTTSRLTILKRMRHGSPRKASTSGRGSVTSVARRSCARCRTVILCIFHSNDLVANQIVLKRVQPSWRLGVELEQGIGTEPWRKSTEIPT